MRRRTGSTRTDDLAVKAVRATMKGWNYAIEHQDEVVDIVMKSVTAGSTTQTAPNDDAEGDGEACEAGRI